jgi:predicted transcriptional regulator
VTRKVRRVVERLAKSPATGLEISADTNISFPALWPVIDRLESNGWITDKDGSFTLTDVARDGMDRARDAVRKSYDPPRPRAWPRGGKRPR